MRPKEVRELIKLNHRYLLITISKQLKDLVSRKITSGNYWKIRIGISRRMRAIRFIVSEDRVILKTEIKDRFKFNIYFRR